MITIQNYVKAESLDEAYELNQKRSCRILGGMMWMRLGTANVQTVVDLSGLGLDQIEETEEAFSIGCMVSLRQLEVNKALNDYFQGALADCVKDIIGVQFRNGATVGGSVFGRFGFSDVLTCLLALDTSVELYKGGIIPLAEFVGRKRDNDILVRILIKKDGRKVSYKAERIARTDFPVIATAVSVKGEEVFAAIGARPMKAALWKGQICDRTQEAIESCAKEAAQFMKYGSNMRGSAEYRRHLAEVCVRRALEKAMKQEENDGTAF